MLHIFWMQRPKWCTAFELLFIFDVWLIGETIQTSDVIITYSTAIFQVEKRKTFAHAHCLVSYFEWEKRSCWERVEKSSKKSETDQIARKFYKIDEQNPTTLSNDEECLQMLQKSTSVAKNNHDACSGNKCVAYVWFQRMTSLKTDERRAKQWQI